MTGDSPFGRESHRAVQDLLPWYVTGQLDPAECQQVEAHLARCTGCRAEFEAEGELASQIANLPLATDAAWDRLRGKMTSRGPIRASPWTGMRRWLARPVKFGWLVAAQFAFAAGAFALLVPAYWGRLPESPYHTLGDPSVGASGNIIVVVGPEMREAALRRALLASEARIVDGPTGSGAYVIQVPAPRRDKALAELRAREGVLLAQAIDAARDPAR